MTLAEKNYRSVENIIRAAGEGLKNNHAHLPRGSMVSGKKESLSKDSRLCEPGGRRMALCWKRCGNIRKKVWP